MKAKNLKKVMAATLSATMVLGMSATTFAADTEIDIPIFSFDVTQVVIPTSYAVAFNPEGLTVKKGSGTSTDQILSKNYGIVNKSNKDKIVTVELTVADQNTGDNVVTFVDTAAEITSAADGEYKIHLTVVPADNTEVKIGTASADKDTAANALNDVAMTPAAANAITLKEGSNKIGFKLDKATYNPKTGSEVTLGTTTGNNVSSNYEIASLAASGKGITAFTFGGEINANADWTKIASGIKITPVYSDETASSTATVITGTGAMVKVEEIPESDGTTAVSIKFTGAAPTPGSVTIKAPGTAPAFTPATNEYPGKIEITTDSIVIKSSWLSVWKGLSEWGTGEYTVTANGQTYKFKLK